LKATWYNFHPGNASTPEKEHCFRLLQEIVTGIKSILSGNMVLLVKLNSNDYTPKRVSLLPWPQVMPDALPIWG
jgi:hypothetical protein